MKKSMATVCASPHGFEIATLYTGICCGGDIGPRRSSVNNSSGTENCLTQMVNKIQYSSNLTIRSASHYGGLRALLDYPLYGFPCYPAVIL
jgi:hypothetical protein